MIEQLPAFPEQPAQTYTVALDGVTYGVRLVWRARPASWYLDLSAEDGTALVLGRRLSAGWAPAVGVRDGLPPGLLYALGLDGYEQLDLGTALRLLYLPAADLPAPASSSEGATARVVPP